MQEYYVEKVTKLDRLKVRTLAVSLAETSRLVVHTGIFKFACSLLPRSSFAPLSTPFLLKIITKLYVMMCFMGRIELLKGVLHLSFTKNAFESINIYLTFISSLSIKNRNKQTSSPLYYNKIVQWKYPIEKWCSSDRGGFPQQTRRSSPWH